jgi:hypothetical protein
VLSVLPISVAEAAEIPSGYMDGGDVTYSGLDLEGTKPTDNTYYTAGDGYILWEPASSTLTLQDVTIDTTTSSAIALKLENDVSTNVVIEGTNNITSSNRGIDHSIGDTSIEGSGTVNIESDEMYGIFQNNGDLTIKGDVTVIVSATGSNMSGICSQYSLIISDNASVKASGDRTDIYSIGNITIGTTGTVNAPIIQADNFIYTAGTMIGSIVYEAKGNNYENCVISVYGNFELTEDTTVWSAINEDGLTVLSDATLTVEEGITLTVEDGAEIVNNGVIVNNGTINLPEGTTAQEITALNLTGSGSIQVNGIDVAVIGDILYPCLSLSETSGLDLSSDTTTSAALYTAGDGYVLWEPTLDDDESINGGTLTLKDVTISNNIDEPLITLPTVDVTIVLEGNNTLENYGRKDIEVSLINQGNAEILDSGEDETYENVEPEDYTLIFDGDGFLDMSSNQTTVIFTDGTLVIEGGTFETFGYGEIDVVDFKMSDGYLYLNGGLVLLRDAEITGGELYTEGSGKGSCICYGDFSITGGIVECGASMMFGGLIMTSGTLTHTGGTFNAIVTTLDYDTMSVISTTYGDAVLEDLEGYPTYILVGSIEKEGITTRYILNIPSNSSLTIPSGAEMRIMGVTADNIGDYFSNEGTLINNGNIILDSGTTTDEVKTIAQTLNASGTGTLVVNDGSATYYTNSGEVMNVYEGNLDLSSQEEDILGDGYTWTGNSTDGYTLTLDNLLISDGGLVLPTNSSVTIVADSSSTISGDIYFSGDYQCDLTITSSSALIVNGSILGNGMNGDKITVEDGAQVIVNGSISLGASGGEDGTLLVIGDKTNLSIISDSSYGVVCDTVMVSDGASLSLTADSYSIMAGKGGVSVTDGSTLSAGCEYGVYIIDGKLTVDSTSTLVTNATVAPFCIVDTTNMKEESDIVSLPGIPTHTEITSVLGSDEYYGYTYWSLVNIGDTLAVTNENSEPVTLSEAVTGTVTFVEAIEDGSGEDESEVDEDSSSDEEDESFVDDSSSDEEDDSFVDDSNSDEEDDSSSSSEEDENTEDGGIENNFYDDVTDSDWFKEAVDYVTEMGLMMGTGENKFAPYISTNRGMIVTILWRLEGQPSATDYADFTDVDEDQYYTDAVAWGAENGIIEGYGNGEFGPEDTITREQMAAILYRYSQFKGYDITQGGMSVGEFSDYEEISDWAFQSMTWAVNTSLISGTDNLVLDPQGEATRAQIATILMRFSENITE